MAVRTDVIEATIEPLVQRGVFESLESALVELTQEYVLNRITKYRSVISRFERKYGMSYHQFLDYLQERSKLLMSSELSEEQRKALSKAIMQEEEDALEWKVAREMLQSWLGLSAQA